jgi:hypothetical protein
MAASVMLSAALLDSHQAVAPKKNNASKRCFFLTITQSRMAIYFNLSHINGVDCETTRWPFETTNLSGTNLKFHLKPILIKQQKDNLYA